MFRGNPHFVRRNSLFRFEKNDIFIDIIKSCEFWELLFRFEEIDILIDMIKSYLLRKR